MNSKASFLDVYPTLKMVLRMKSKIIIPESKTKVVSMAIPGSEVVLTSTRVGWSKLKTVAHHKVVVPHIKLIVTGIVIN